MGTRGKRWVQSIQGGYKGYEGDMTGMRCVQHVQGGYEGYKVNTIGMRGV